MSKRVDIVDTFTIAQAALLSSLSVTMVDYLCRQAVLIPSLPDAKARVRGRQRRYTFGDVVILRVIAQLLQAGVSVQRLKKALKSLRKYHAEITATSLPAQYLVTDGHKVYLRQNNSTLEALDEDGQMAFVFVVELSQAQTEVSQAAQKMRENGGAS